MFVSFLPLIHTFQVEQTRSRVNPDDVTQSGYPYQVSQVVTRKIHGIRFSSKLLKLNLEIALLI